MVPPGPTSSSQRPDNYYTSNDDTANVDRTIMGDDACSLQLVTLFCRSRFDAAWTQAVGFHGTDATIAAGFDSGAQLGIPRLPRFASRYDIDSDATAREILANAVPTTCDCGDWARATEALQGDRPC